MPALSRMFCLPSSQQLSVPVKKLSRRRPKINIQRDTAFVSPILSLSDTETLQKVAGELGPDSTSKDFAARTKSIGFVLCLSGRWFQINQNFFNQASEYNEASGGYRRYYRQFPPVFIQSSITQRLLNKFKYMYDIPDGELILVQVQTSHISAANEGRCLTGQGIHSDGADRAMLAILHRKNIRGARSSVYRDVDGLHPIIKPTELQEGEVMFWKDNEIYHYVEPAVLDDKSQSGERTVLIAHYPAMQFISGETNPNNTLPPSGKHPPTVALSDLE